MLKSHIYHVVLPVLCWGSIAFGAMIDNSSLVPVMKPDAEVRLEKSNDGTREIPDWVKSLIIVELRVDAVSTDGTLKGMERALDHVAEMGVNCVWITPPLNDGNGYGNFGLHTISPRLTGEKERAEQWAVLRNFVVQAHKRNIRVLFDVINWGVTKHEGGAKLPKEKPEWFGEYYPKYAGWLFNWKNKDFNEWYASQLVEWVRMTGVDGFRCDCSPFYAGYGPYETAKKRLRELGYKTLFVAEWASARKNVFDFDQASMLKAPDVPRWVGDAFLEKNLVDMVRSSHSFCRNATIYLYSCFFVPQQRDCLVPRIVRETKQNVNHVFILWHKVLRFSVFRLFWHIVLRFVSNFHAFCIQPAAKMRKKSRRTNPCAAASVHNFSYRMRALIAFAT